MDTPANSRLRTSDKADGTQTTGEPVDGYQTVPVRTTTTSSPTSQSAISAPGDTPFGSKPLGRVGGKALRTQLRHIRDGVATVYAVSGAEDIHQMRVATRRLRSMARVLEATPAFRRRRVARLRRQLQPLAEHLGAVRDLDILSRRLDAYERAIVEMDQETNSASGALRDELLRRRVKALKRLRKELRRPALRKLLRHPRRTAKRLVARGQSGHRILVRYVAGDALWQRYEAILRFEEVVAAAAPEQLHALRIACKQLRYALELFSEESDPCVQSLLLTLKDVQDHLGELQDSVFAVTLLTHLLHDSPRNQLLADFRATQELRRNTLRQDFTPLWERISGAPYRQDLAALIAAL